jgi:hypothetical protein
MIEVIINKIRNELSTVFKEVFGWFESDKVLLIYQPKNNGWSVRNVLEHIALTNHFLLILIKKGTLKALANAKKIDYSDLLNSYNFDWHNLKAVGEHESFYWNRPDHMEPTGAVDIAEVKTQLEQQLAECFNCLAQLKNGEGVLYKTTMTVNGLGKIDVYHYLLFLAMHAKRHLTQMQKIQTEFDQI